MGGSSIREKRLGAVSTHREGDDNEPMLMGGAVGRRRELEIFRKQWTQVSREGHI